MPDRISFVCQAGDIEPKAILLAASLRRHFPSYITLIAAHPTNCGELRAETREAFRALDVRILPIRNPFSGDYPIGHKYMALALLGGPGHGLFLDSDIMTMSTPEEWPSELSAVPATHNHYSKKIWDSAYEYYGLKRPESGFMPTLVSGDRTAPYFNSGMIALPGPEASWFASIWIDTAAALRDNPQVPVERNLSQLALPIAAARFGQNIHVLDSRWNFAGWAWKLAGRTTPIFFHYQQLARIRQEPVAMRALEDAAEVQPSVRRALGVFGFLS